MGQSTFNGSWNGSDPAWTRELRLEVSHFDIKDGEFFISIEDFHRNFEYTVVGIDVTGMH